MRCILRGLVALVALILVSNIAQAQFGIIQQGLDATKGKKSDAHNVADEKTAGKGYATAQTFTNAERNFTYTVPAGWRLESGSPTGNNPVFMKPGTTWSFQLHFTAMNADFPAGSSVAASLKQSQGEVKTGRLIDAKRRDIGDYKKKCGAIGWEITESPTGGGGSHQRIIWQGYDGQNYYYNFNTTAHPDQFEAAKAELRSIQDSIKFCTK
ncbi:MAG: hypothetical protein HY795_13180 [Desulfovibrio sp.]|nr:hypothetical protein [Desulfovibrio sp.]MBI4961508.1 hypothetical protein [Desulfovibrio sp.]